MAQPGQLPLDFSDFLEQQPRALYQSYLNDPRTRMTSSMRRYYQNQFQNIQQEYLGELARQMRQNKVPTMRFQDYLTQNIKGSPRSGMFRDPAKIPTYRDMNPIQQARSRQRFTGYDRFRRESPYTRSAYTAGPFTQSMFAPSARWITY